MTDGFLFFFVWQVWVMNVCRALEERWPEPWSSSSHYVEIERLKQKHLRSLHIYIHISVFCICLDGFEHLLVPPFPVESSTAARKWLHLVQYWSVSLVPTNQTENVFFAKFQDFLSFILSSVIYYMLLQRLTVKNLLSLYIYTQCIGH